MPAKTFKSDQNLRLMSGYKAWADTLAPNANVAIALDDPVHALAAFLGVLSTGRSCGVIAPNQLNRLAGEFTYLTQEKPPASGTIRPINHPFITFTGGTTGAAKMVLRSPESWIYSFEKQQITASDNVAILGSLHHSLALYGSVEALYFGAALHNYCNFTHREQLIEINEHEISVLYATPTQLRLLGGDVPNTSVKRIFVGGGPFGQIDYERTQGLFLNAEIRTFYGTAETSFISMSDKDTPRGSVGQAYHGVTMDLQNAEVFVHSPMLADKYLNSSLPRKGNFVATGELGYLDESGYLFLTGRKDRAVTIADQTIHLDVIEDELRKNSRVTEAAVIALPDKLRGLKAYGAVYGTQNTPKHALLSGVIVLNNWPQLESGKTDYHSITDEIKRRFK